MADLPAPTDPTASFGPNQWLVDELYEQYLHDKHSVDEAWWPFFDDYKTRGHGPRARSGATDAAPTSAGKPSDKPAGGATDKPSDAPAPRPGAGAPGGQPSTPPAPRPSGHSDTHAAKSADGQAARSAGEGDQAATKPSPERAANAQTGAE